MAQALHSFYPMIEQATAIATSGRADTAYKSWEAAGKRAIMRLDINERTAGPIPTFDTMVHNTALAAQGTGSSYAPQQAANGSNTNADISYESPEDEFSFGDVIDMINPLQHLPVIGMLYRNLTGDTIKPISNIIGGTIFGGPIGAVSSTINSIVKMETGRDVAENALAFIGIDIAPKTPPKPDIEYIAPVKNADAQTLDGTTLAVADLTGRVTSTGAKNFATTQKSSSIFMNT